MEDHNLLFHSVKSGNKQAFDVVLKRSDVDWQNDKGTESEKLRDIPLLLFQFMVFLKFIFAALIYPQVPLLYIGQ